RRLPSAETYQVNADAATGTQPVRIRGRVLEDKETLAKIAKGAKKQMKKGNFGQGARIARLVYETRIARAWHSRQETRVASNHASRQETPGARTARPVAESTSFELSVPSPAKRSVAGGRDTG